ncbi:putative protein C22orf31-like protein [Labeo rohita]|uniref:Uncharacterized protein n=1 Tax=Labeo rohita TaxID=84645 RepID=A0A498M9B5_LABRO|nr:putative protein C22orf31-like protein [Labeo rohita]
MLLPLLANASGRVVSVSLSMEQRRLSRTRALSTHLRGFLVEGISSFQDPCELSQLAAVIRKSLSPSTAAAYRVSWTSTALAEPMMKTRCGRRRPYSLELGLKIKQRLWETLNCPALVETEQPDGRVLITESFSTTSRSFAPRIHVDISEEPQPEEPRRKKPRH